MINKKNVENIIDLSPNQEGILYYYLMNPEGSQYNVQFIVQVEGDINYELFEKACNEVIAHNDMLRTVFRWENVKRPIQITLKSHELKLQTYHFSSDLEIEQFIQSDYRKPFQLEHSLIRVSICHSDNSQNVIVLTIHHIIYDGWSNGIFWKELIRNYSDLCKGHELITPTKQRYSSYIKIRKQIDKNTQKEFWERYLNDIDEATRLEEKNRNVQKGYGIVDYRLKTTQEFEEKLAECVKQTNTSLANLVYAAWGLLLQFYCNRSDVVFGRVVSGRNLKLTGIEDMIGMFINTLPIKLDIKKKQSLKEYLNEVKKKVLEAETFETTPLYEIKDYIGLRTNRELFNSIVVIENYPLDMSLLKQYEELKVIHYSCRETNHYDLTLCVEMIDGLEWHIMYNHEVFSNKYIAQLMGHFEQIMNALMKNQEALLEDIKILDDQEEKVLETFNDTNALIETKRSVVQLFEEQVKRNPDSIALISSEGKLTYQEFNEKSNQIAHLLLEQGIKKNNIIGIMLERGTNMLLAIYGVLKAGGAYLPIDPKNPDDRIHYIIENAGMKMILSVAMYEERIQNIVPFIDVNQILESSHSKTNPEVQNEPDDVCYVIYTSGTTGKPKGVVIRHISLVNRLQWMQKNTNISRGDVLLQKTNYTFDVSVWELIWWSLEGASLALIQPGGEKNPADILEAIDTYGITTIHFVPSMLNAFLLYLENVKNENKLHSLKYVITSGEALTLETVKKFDKLIGASSPARLVNLYGPTEATIDVSYFNCPKNDSSLEYIPIGKPIDNIKLHVLAPNGQLQPVGIAGELCISGIGLAKGYLNQPELTSQKFVNGKIIEGERYYRTGDLARWTSDGMIEYFGRLDSQIKIRGFRIELDEIETVINHFAKVEDAAVLAKRDQQNEYYLVAYVVTKEKIDINEIKNYLKDKLPSYMVPAFIEQMRNFPIKPNGKLDRIKLAQIPLQNEIKYEGIDIKYQNEIEKEISKVWDEVLPGKKYGLHDNFFDVGGNSISLIRVYSKLSKVYPNQLNTEDLFNYPSIASLAEYLLGKHVPQKEMEQENVLVNDNDDANDVAVIGIAGTFPEAENVNEFWSNLVKGKECIHFFSEEELKEGGVSEKIYKDENYVAATGKLKNGKTFDAAFFNYTQKEAEVLDPQIRLMMINVCEALEDSGYYNDFYDGKIGLYVGASPNYFWENAVISSGKAKVLGDFTAEKLFNKDHIAAQIAYKLNLQGPVGNLYTACSTSLVAVHLAVNTIKNHECNLAVAGGVSYVSYYGNYGYLYQEGMVFSPDGHCRPLDQSGNGFVGGSGTGSVVLKRLDLAKKDGDHIYCVIKGSGVTNDGNNKVGYASPSLTGQINAIKEAFRIAKVEPESVQYIETHGTGTALGDLIEVKALEQVYGKRKKNYCALGSVKANIGHLDCAAGIAGLIKTVLILANKEIPPLINMSIPNSKLNLQEGPFYINDETIPFDESEKPYRAAVNGIGLGGTNAHVILEEYRPELKEYKEQTRNMDYAFCLSAKSETALKSMCGELSKFIKKHSELNENDIAYTLRTGRKEFCYRKVVRADYLKQMINMLNKLKRDKFEKTEPKTEFAFYTHNKSFYLDFDKNYYLNNSVVLENLKVCLNEIEELTGFDLESELFQKDYSSKRIEKLEYDKILNFIILYGNMKSFATIGITPSYLYGRGVAEVANLVMANVITLREALIFLIERKFGNRAFRKEVTTENTKLKKALIKCYISEKEKWYANEEFLSWNDLSEMDLEDTRELVYQNIQVQDNEDGIFHISFDCFNMWNQVNDLWEQGVDINWKNWYGEQRYQKVSLPTYCFDRHEYWIEQVDIDNSIKQKDRKLVKNEDISKWFYLPCWEQEMLLDCDENRSENIVCFTKRADTFSKEFIEKLKERSTVIAVYLANAFSKNGTSEYEVNADSKEDFIALLNDLESSGLDYLRIVYVADAGTGGETDDVEPEFFHLLYLCNAVNEVSSMRKMKIHVITRNGIRVTGTEILRPKSTMLHTLGLVVSQELSKVQVQILDLEDREEPTWKVQCLAEILTKELFGNKGQFISAYRNNKRYIRHLKMKVFPEGNTQIVKKNGIYLIIGGLGGVGIELAKHMARNKIKLILVGRTKLPEKEQWETWLESHEDSNIVNCKIKAIKEMESLGAEVYPISADATKEEEMDSLIKEIENRFGSLNGVIFATVANNKSMFKPVTELKKEDCKEQFKPKIAGIKILQKVLEGKSIDFCLIMSSTSVILGGLGFAAYSAANAYMDCFVEKHNQMDKNQWIIVNWESWDVTTNQSVFDFKAGIQELSMKPAQGCEVFDRILRNPDAEHVVISSGDLEIRLKEWVDMKQEENQTLPVVAYEDMGLSSVYMAPKSELEDIIAKIWAEFFGVAKVGIDDNLFEMGATSLSIIQLNTNLRNELNRNIPIVKLFAYPTVRELAMYLSDEELEKENKVERTVQVGSGRKSTRKRLELRKKRE